MIATAARCRTASRAWFLVACLAGCCVADGAATARTMQQKLDQACAADIDRLCPSAKGNPDAAKACLMSHREAADPACMRLVDAAE
jgi:hypothetical protein